MQNSSFLYLSLSLTQFTHKYLHSLFIVSLSQITHTNTLSLTHKHLLSISLSACDFPFSKTQMPMHSPIHTLKCSLSLFLYHNSQLTPTHPRTPIHLLFIFPSQLTRKRTKLSPVNTLSVLLTCIQRPKVKPGV